MKRLTAIFLGSLLVALAALLAFRASAEQVRTANKADAPRRLVGKRVGFVKKRKGFADEYVPILAAAQSVVEEREFKNTIPAHVPIKVKVKSEQSFKKMGNKDWLRELEIEVKNTGSKPIYFMYVILEMDDLFVGGYPLTFQVHYGRKDLIDLEVPIEPDDVPIRPGESVTLKVSEGRVNRYEENRRNQNRPDPKRVKLELQLINFGDGTGLHSTQGQPLAYPPKKRSQNVPRPEAVPGTGPPNFEARISCSPELFRNATQSTMPASFLRANFSLPDVASTFGLTPAIQSSFCGCQNDNNCMWGYLGTPSCCDNPNEYFFGVLPAGGCADRKGRCFRTETSKRRMPFI